MASYNHPASSVDTLGMTGTPYINGETSMLGSYYVYLDAADGTVKRAFNNGTAAQANVIGITLNTASRIGVPVNIAKVGRLHWVGGGFELGGKLLVLGVGGRSMDFVDLAIGEYITILGWTEDLEYWQFKPFVTAQPYRQN
jgi:hypothetical protein